MEDFYSHPFAVLNAASNIQVQVSNTKPELPIITQTAYAFDNEKDKIIKAGCNDYISTPIKIDDLLTIIEKKLAKLSIPFNQQKGVYLVLLESGPSKKCLKL